jgi:hypothetical protein
VRSHFSCTLYIFDTTRGRGGIRYGAVHSHFSCTLYLRHYKRRYGAVRGTLSLCCTLYRRHSVRLRYTVRYGTVRYDTVRYDSYTSLNERTNRACHVFLYVLSSHRAEPPRLHCACVCCFIRSIFAQSGATTFTLSLVVRDNGFPAKQATGRVVISVVNVNEAPVFADNPAR